MKFELSPEDTARWGVRSAKAFVTLPGEAVEIANACRRDRVRFVIVRCPAEQTAAAQALEGEGMRLMDTLVFFSRALGDWSPEPMPYGISTRVLGSAEIDIARSIAEEGFRDYAGHYHADPRLNPKQSDAVYVDWSLKLCRSTEESSMTLLALVDGEPVGYMAFRLRRGQEGEAVLGAVLERSRRRGVYRALLGDGITWMRSRGAEAVMVSSQIANIGVQRVWTRMGFEPHHFLYTFHGWF